MQQSPVVMLVDIDALKRSTEQLREARDYAVAIVETVPTPLLVLNLNLQVITANHAFYETFQVLPAQTEQRSIFELGNGQWNGSELRSRLEAMLAGDARLQNFEIEHDFEQIGSRIMRLNARKIPIVDDAQMILLAIEDITEQKRLEIEHAQLLIQAQAAQLEAETANRAKDEFLSTLSHELRNPLNAIIGWTQLLRLQRFDNAETDQALETIERSAEAQNHLIEDILDISRITTGRFQLNAYQIELVPIITAAIAIVRLAAEAKSIQLESRLQETAETVSGDPLRLQQVLWNLLANAIKFTPPGGRITVTLEYRETEAQIQVSDTGQGIPPEFLPYVFDRFRQAESGRTRTNPGLGIGLSIVRHVVELHGGSVSAASAGIGQGSTFTVKLPLRSTLEESSTLNDLELVDLADLVDRPSLPHNLPLLSGLRVLLVDDEAGMRALLTTMLKQYGVEADAAASAPEALSMLTTSPERYDLLLSDIGMPEQDGYALIRQIRALGAESGGQIPAAALTAYVRDTERQEAIAAGFQMHVSKPVTSVRLAWVVANLSGRTFMA